MICSLYALPKNHERKRKTVVELAQKTEKGPLELRKWDPNLVFQIIQFCSKRTRENSLKLFHGHQSSKNWKWWQNLTKTNKKAQKMGKNSLKS